MAEPTTMADIDTIVVKMHAINRLRKRRVAWRRETNQTIREYIAGEVRSGLAVGGRHNNHKPKAFRLFGEGGRTLPRGEVCVWTADGDVAWIVKEQDGALVVITTLTRAQAVQR